MTTLVSWAGVIPEPRPSGRATWSFDRPLEPAANDHGVTTYVIEVGPLGQNATDIQARLEVYPRDETLADRLTAAGETRSKVTVLLSGENFLGCPRAEIAQGTVFLSSRGPALIPTGKRTHGFSLKGAVDMIEGATAAAVTELNNRWYTRTSLPPTTKVTPAMLKGASKANPLCVLWTHPGFDGGRVPGCVWFLDEVDDEIANGYLWCPPSTLFSEHGSTYVKDILDGAAVIVPPAISFAACFDLPTDALEAYRIIFGN
jgi:hypothetical protein